LVCGLALLGAAPAARASWPTSTSTNLPVCTATGVQTDVVALADGVGGTFVAWTDQRFGQRDVFVQHVSANGSALWRTDGVLVGGAANTQDQPVIALDGVGGIYVAWRDLRSGTNADIYAQRVSSAGTIVWALNGVVVCNVADDQVLPAIAGATGASTKALPVTITWEDYRSGVRVYAQRLTSSGVRMWATDGIPLTTSLAPQFQPVMCDDGEGGAIVAWSKQGVDGYDVAAQRLSSTGTLLWDPAGVAVCGASGAQIGVRARGDGANGAWFVWEDGRGATLQVYAQHVTSAGTAALTGDGVPLASSSGDQMEPVATTDDAGGVIAAWHDTRLGDDIYSQRLDATGGHVWGDSGAVTCAASGTQQFPSIAPDGVGGALVAWEDYRGANGDIWAQRMGPDGIPVWPTNGLTICSANGAQYSPVIVSDHTVNGIVLWSDQRTSGSDVYAMNAPPSAWLDVSTAAASLPRLVAAPNPARGATAFAFTIARAGRLELALFDDAGRRVRTLARGPHPAGDALVPWDGRDDAGRACAPGVYFARLSLEGSALATRRTVLWR
jgi:hypothetical protein